MYSIKKMARLLSLNGLLLLGAAQAFLPASRLPTYVAASTACLHVCMHTFTQKSINTFNQSIHHPLRPTRPAAIGRPHGAMRMLATGPLLNDGLELAQQASSLFLAYTDDSKASLNTEIGVVSFAGAAAGLTALFFLLTKNLKGKSFSFVLDEAEQAAVDAVTAIFDPTVRAVFRGFGLWDCVPTPLLLKRMEWIHTRVHTSSHRTPINAPYRRSPWS